MYVKRTTNSETWVTVLTLTGQQWLLIIKIVKVFNKYSKIKTSLSLHFLKNNFKMIKEICHKNASNFK